MCSIAMESQCMKAVRAHVVHKSEFITNWSQNTLQIFPAILHEFAKPADYDFLH